jgi:hypothetical protein
MNTSLNTTLCSPISTATAEARPRPRPDRVAGETRGRRRPRQGRGELGNTRVTCRGETDCSPSPSPSAGGVADQTYVHSYVDRRLAHEHTPVHPRRWKREAATQATQQCLASIAACSTRLYVRVTTHSALEANVPFFFDTVIRSLFIR